MDDTIKTLYHATNKEISLFNSYTHFGTLDAAKQRGGNKFIAEGIIYKAQVKIKNPLRVDDIFLDFRNSPLERFAMEKFLKDNRILNQNDISIIFKPASHDFIEQMQEMILVQQKGLVFDTRSLGQELWKPRLITELEKKGQDSMVYKNTTEDEGQDSYIIFRHNQVVGSTKFMDKNITRDGRP